ncbi:TonB-dependent receptor [Inhella sp.]|uniref:TonB-dependent receptor n=1 Tax=Inhella sp. TaxID=1921806 RepID=UPI0035B3166E
MFKKTKVCASVLLAVGGGVLATSMPAFAQEAQKLERIEVTGSRIKRADAEGALPVTVITRAELEASGSTTVAEFIRNSTFASTGQFRPQSGSSAQSFSGVNLRGLGSNRTLVLVDGRRVAKAPNVGDSADMNSIPMAAVERIEILTDGASAIYGSDAIGGVVNVVLRKDFEGVHLMAGKTNPSIKGGNREEASAILGITGEKGRVVMGASRTSRDIIWVRDYPWGAPKGASSYSNHFYQAIDIGGGEYLPNISGGGSRGKAGTCDFPDKGFYVDATGRCRYDFNLVAADEAATGAKSIFARGEFRINSDWNAYLNVSSTNNTSFGRYAPVPDSILVTPGSVLANRYNFTQPVFLAHRFAAAGNRDTSTDATLTDYTAGFQGTVGSMDVDMGVRRTVSKYQEIGRGFIVKGLATAAINNGVYQVDNPFLNSDQVLKSITTTTGRDGLWAQTDYFANASFDLFQMGNGAARMYVGLDRSLQQYADIYDSLSEAGEVLGSSGSSAEGHRTVSAGTVEVLFPIMKGLEASVAGRYEKYSDYGNDFSPKVSVRYQPMRSLTLRASAGEGFRAPTLPELNQKPAFSADTVVDPRHCLADGGFTAAECETEEFQINGLRISNPALKSEKSKQWSIGAVWDVMPNLSTKLDVWHTKIHDVINFVSAQQIVDRDNGDSKLPIPEGLSIRRDPSTGAILQIVSGSSNEGVLNYGGFDASVLFSHKWAGIGNFSHELTYSRVTKAEQDGVDYNGTFGSPKHRAVLANSWKLGGFAVQYNINVIGKNGDREGDYVPTYTTHDMQFAWDTPLKGAKLILGVNNLTEKFPALVGSPYDQKPFNYYLYDAYGRQYYGRIEMKF